jgi:hypothetical protein
MFLSLLIINTSLVARRTRNRVIGGYDSTREGDKGISAYLFYITHFVCNGGGGGGISYMSSWGKTKRFLIPTNYKNPSLVCGRGLGWFVRSFVLPLENTLILIPIMVLLLVTSCTHSPIFFIVHPLSWSLHSFHPFIHSSFLTSVSCLGKGI